MTTEENIRTYVVSRIREIERQIEDLRCGQRELERLLNNWPNLAPHPERPGRQKPRAKSPC